VNTPGDGNPANNQATPVTAGPVAPALAPDLVITIGQPFPALTVGVTSTLPISVSNIGTAVTTGPIIVTVNVPANITVPASFTTGNFGCVVASGTVTCTSNTPITAGSSTTLAVPLTPTAGAVGSTPTFTGGVNTPGDGNPANNQATPVTAGPVAPAPVSALSLRVKVLLQGALINSSASPLMRDDLRTGGYLPMTTPYSAAVSPRFAQTGGGGGETTTATVLTANGGTPNAIVDWVLVELRDAANSANIVATRSALVQRDGDVVLASDGTSPLSFSSLTGSSYYVSIKHRNHLGVMTATAIPLSSTTTLVDFTTLSAAATYDKSTAAINYDGLEMVTVGGKRALWAGNANHDNKVKYVGGLDDNTTILNDVINAQPGNATPAYNYDLAYGYFYGDVDMNGKAKYQGGVNDTSIIFSNVLALYSLNVQGGQVYNYDLFIEQLP
ncbi:hypothetical protein, partial [Spirosoma sp.]|uniref:hypothetical protein n=1 Tax=Spirosoma sp. TaxID=1899569 RepID=UPI002629DE4B